MAMRGSSHPTGFQYVFDVFNKQERQGNFRKHGHGAGRPGTDYQTQVNPDLHQMLVAVATENKEIVGSYDIDARPCQTNSKLRRPYLSDLAVHPPDHRRRGIAKALVKASEEFV